ncbi:hypothetical protein IHE44_0013579 [Lamprotornis superbus]|uniref:Mab-21-like HhH/H2TH-like domain-containing protein n=1 Tax=Lamprotornis superbus TaxID=245042 RepID=A0A835TVR7_9PASS|nr:hypothetical protein IHE44_0013579 [Lamprotornis superbus]
MRITMDAITFLFMLLQSLIQYLQPVGDALDEQTHLRMELRAKRLEQKRIQLEQEMEQLALMQSGRVWGDLLWFFLQPWQVWVVTGLLVLLLGLYFFWRKRSDEAENSGEEDGEYHILDSDLRWLLDKHIQWPVLDLQRGCEWTTDLMDNYAVYFGHVLSNSFYPVLQRAIGVGSAFEGWSPREQDVVYQVLIPMTPPRGHSFHLELDSAEQRHVRNFRVRVQLECTCTKEQQGENMLCFLHHPEEELRRNQDPSLLDTLCTDSYLDVQKTARWFYQLAPPESLHLRCLQLFTRLLLGIGFSTYTIKTIVMHLLNTVPVSRWCRRYFLRRLGDINVTLHCCLEEKHLNHFVIGNKRFPQEIGLPLDIASAEPPNLFHHLTQYPAAHSQAMTEYQDLQHRLARSSLAKGGESAALAAPEHKVLHKEDGEEMGFQVELRATGASDNSLAAPAVAGLVQRHAGLGWRHSTGRDVHIPPLTLIHSLDLGKTSSCSPKSQELQLQEA